MDTIFDRLFGVNSLPVDMLHNVAMLAKVKARRYFQKLDKMENNLKSVYVRIFLRQPPQGFCAFKTKQEGPYDPRPGP